MYVCGVSDKAKVLYTMNQYSMKSQGPQHKKLTKIDKLEFNHCVTNCCGYYNTLQNFSLHLILVPSWVFYIVFQNTRAHFMNFLALFWSLLHVVLTVVF